MNSNKWMQILGLANRARKLISGEELVVKEIRKGQVNLVLLSADASQNTMKKITDKCKSYKTPYRIVENRFLLGQSIGKEARVVVAVLDEGFANKLKQVLD